MDNATIEDIYRELKLIQSKMVTKTEIERVLETIAVLSNKNTMKQIMKSERDIAEGRTKIINSIDDL